MKFKNILFKFASKRLTVSLQIRVLLHLDLWEALLLPINSPADGFVYQCGL
jgi:hypothetical protein